MLNKVIFTVAFLAASMLFSFANETNVRLLFFKKKSYVQHENVISEIDKKGNLKKIFESNEKINDALLTDTEMWLATSKGVRIYNLSDMKLAHTYFPADNIEALSIDAEKKIWVATTFNGVYRQIESGDFQKKLNVTANYCLVSTPDSNVYVGTNLGLYKIPIDGNQIIRYAEEAHSGHGLPDNLVERLFADSHSNVWIMMPENIAFKKSDNTIGEIPTFSYVGSTQNEIYNIVSLQNQTYLFVTKDGVIFIPPASLKEHGHQEEVFSGHDAHAFSLSNKALKAPKNLQDETVLFAEKHDNRIYFYTASGVWNVPEKKIEQMKR